MRRATYDYAKPKSRYAIPVELKNRRKRTKIDKKKKDQEDKEKRQEDKEKRKEDKEKKLKRKRKLPSDESDEKSDESESDQESDEEEKKTTKKKKKIVIDYADEALFDEEALDPNGNEGDEPVAQERLDGLMIDDRDVEEDFNHAAHDYHAAAGE